jgi:hypothetical protein
MCNSNISVSPLLMPLPVTLNRRECLTFFSDTRAAAAQAVWPRAPCAAASTRILPAGAHRRRVGSILDSGQALGSLLPLLAMHVASDLHLTSGRAHVD